MKKRFLKETGADIALLTEQRYAASAAARDDWYLRNILADDALLQSALESLGLTAIRLDWARPDIDWSRFRCAVFRTTWDYFDRMPEFTLWLDRVQSQTRLCNEASIIRWNLDKHYLADLEARGVPVVPYRFVEPGEGRTLSDLLDLTGWPEAVLKPCVSGGARHTYRVDRKNAGALQAQVQPLLDTESFLFQPFIQNIMEQGEDTLMVIDGQFTHAVRKMAKPGDFRVQDDHGGTVRALEPESGQVQLAEQAMNACRPAPAYGRVDMVLDNEDRLAVMELELIEPELWLRFSPPAAEHLARAVVRAAGR